MEAAAAAMAVVRYGIVGVGMMGREHMINLSHLRDEGASVTCIADPHLPSRQAALDLAASFGWTIQVFSGHRELLDRDLCDVVVVSSPNMTHFGILMDIIEHPRPHHVLVEKPLCTTVEDCKKVIEAAKRRPEILVHVGLEYRYMPPVAKLIEVVKSGRIGEVKMVAIREHRFPFLVKVNNWNRFNANSGGTLVEKCCHFFDLMRLFAASNPVCVMASGSIDVNHKDEIYDGKIVLWTLGNLLCFSRINLKQVPDIIDNAYVIIEFDNGTRGMLDLCMFAEGSKNEQEISVVGDIGKGEAFVPESIVRVGTRTGGRAGVQTLHAVDERINLRGGFTNPDLSIVLPGTTGCTMDPAIWSILHFCQLFELKEGTLPLLLTCMMGCSPSQWVLLANFPSSKVVSSPLMRSCLGRPELKNSNGSSAFHVHVQGYA
ncbi:hypothetical protein Taro_052903 [Colocasia esculenta]|uniref:Gfo/Idh/MocA-like oxidoreductase N-terminal domain-containing protein n=1 Tax=Colocasia esculenta TaxID=4460 RepID=A0A843XL90_COLES|nr:hypothetical protein [Colocasia esculenta]